MNILGIGPAEIVVIFIVLIVFAGPKRMIAWSYVLGQYVAKFRAMVDEAWGQIRKEFEAAQIDLPKQPPTLNKRGFNLLDEANKLVDKEMGKSSSGVINEVASAAQSAKNAFQLSDYAPGMSSTNTSAASNRDPKGESAPSEPNDKTTENPKYDAWLPQ
ncbi:MAG: hypothetical protein IT322_07955 [Anaerolineae bacterium]|nr:hypothetical protein [Anaerolineae bacterium]CAG0970570.1 hypothetical protein ANRL4_01233 [Anaerolineae bacterium]